MNTPIQTPPPSEPKLDVSDTLSEAWRLTYGIKWQIFICSFLLPVLIATLAGVIIALTTPMNYNENNVPQVIFNPFSIVILTLSGLVIWFFQFLANIIGVKQALGLSVSVKDAIADCGDNKVEMFYMFFYWFVVFVGTTFIPFIGGIIYIYLVLPLYIYIIPLVVIKKSDMKFAINIGFGLLNKNLLMIVILYLIMMVLVIISSIPAGIGLIWTLPMLNAMFGTIFRKTYTPAQVAEHFGQPKHPDQS